MHIWLHELNKKTWFRSIWSPVLFSWKVSKLIYSSLDDHQTDNRWGVCSVCAAGTPGAVLPRLHLSGREAWHDFAPSAHVKRRSNPRKLFPRAAACFMQCERRCSWNTTLPERPWVQIACGMCPINNAASWLFVYARGLCHFIVFSWTLLTAYLWRVTERKHPRMQMLRLLELADAAGKTRLDMFQSFDFISIYHHVCICSEITQLLRICSQVQYKCFMQSLKCLTVHLCLVDSYPNILILFFINTFWYSILFHY